MNNPLSLQILSSYRTKPCILRIGPSKEKFYIHEGVLLPYPGLLKACDPSRGSATERELLVACEEIGHTLVHYLYTRDYEKLQPQAGNYDTTELKKIGQLYGVAVKYDISGLSMALQEQMRSTEANFDIFDVLAIAKAAHELLSEENVWLAQFIREIALTADKDLFTTSQFLELTGVVQSFNRALMRSMAEVYDERLAAQARQM